MDVEEIYKVLEKNEPDHFEIINTLKINILKFIL
jgi:hypothetical protein